MKRCRRRGETWSNFWFFSQSGSTCTVAAVCMAGLLEGRLMEGNGEGSACAYG
jgi:hypothetical protein